MTPLQQLILPWFGVLFCAVICVIAIDKLSDKTGDGIQPSVPAHGPHRRALTATAIVSAITMVALMAYVAHIST